MNTKQIKILVSNGKTELYHSNFQIIKSLSMIEMEGSLFTVLKDSKGFYIPSSGSSGNRYIQKIVESGERIYFVS